MPSNVIATMFSVVHHDRKSPKPIVGHSVVGNSDSNRRG